MLLTINHVSSYHYDQAVPYAVQRLRLWPATVPGQVVREWHVEAEGVEHEVSYVDGFGNRTQLLRHQRNVEDIHIRSHGLVETEDRNGVFGHGNGGPPPWIFLRETALTLPGEHMRALADGSGSTSQLSLLHGLMARIHERVSYLPGATSVATDAETALINGAGVCQDHAHIFISAARLLAIPARYVSGYLRVEGAVEQTASHAWAEAYVDDLGWIGFDIANAICPEDNYVRIACGLDYRSAAPISGIRAGAAGETLAVAVSVQQAQ